jgi:hypothetical protein
LGKQAQELPAIDYILGIDRTGLFLGGGRGKWREEPE